MHYETSTLLLWFTCKPEGSGILLALVLLEVIMIEFDRDDRLLRAEEGREDDLLSEINTRQTPR